jgi:hypothetical protein
MQEHDFPRSLCRILAKHVRWLLEELPPKPPVSGMPAGFTESDLRGYLSHLSEEEALARPRGCPMFVIERQLPKDKRRTCVDYAFVRKHRPIAAADVLATCELKGPVRKTFFHLHKFNGNWAPKVVKDAGKQLERGKRYKDARHYIALLVPNYKVWSENHPLVDVLSKIETRVRGAALVQKAHKRVWLSQRLPLDIIILQVERKAFA